MFAFVPATSEQCKLEEQGPLLLFHTFTNSGTLTTNWPAHGQSNWYNENVNLNIITKEQASCKRPSKPL